MHDLMKDAMPVKVANTVSVCFLPFFFVVVVLCLLPHFILRANECFGVYMARYCINR